MTTAHSESEPMEESDTERLARIHRKATHGFPPGIEDTKWLLGQLGMPVAVRKRCVACGGSGEYLGKCAMCDGAGYFIEGGV